MKIIDWRRLIVALPVLAVVGAALFWLLRDGDATASTPRAALEDTPAVAGHDVGVQKGKLARDFSATTADGEAFRLSDLRGKPAIINFWATWCTSCLVEMPDLKEIQAEFGADKLRVVAVNSGESNGDALEFVEFLDADDFIYAMDPSLAVTDAYGVIGLSTSVFVDADGVIRATYTGQLPKDLMREFASAAIAATEAAEPPVRFRLPGTVEARTSVLVVDDIGKVTLRITSRRLRCDDSFCAGAIVDAIEGTDGVISVQRALSADPPYIEVMFDNMTVDRERVLTAIVAAVNDGGDPLYQTAVTIENGNG
jgi:thiol-disulfide isomerase/thioredoxin